MQVGKDKVFPSFAVASGNVTQLTIISLPVALVSKAPSEARNSETVKKPDTTLLFTLWSPSEVMAKRARLINNNSAATQQFTIKNDIGTTQAMYFIEIHHHGFRKFIAVSSNVLTLKDDFCEPLANITLGVNPISKSSASAVPSP